MFRVHGFFFQRESSIFSKKLNPASPGQVKEGTNDNDPVVLEEVTPEEFEKFLWVFYNPYVPPCFLFVTSFSQTTDYIHCMMPP